MDDLDQGTSAPDAPDAIANLPTTEAPKTSMADSLSALWDETQAPPEERAEKAARARDEAGRFVKADETAPDPANPDVAPPAPAEGEAVAPPPVTDPPATVVAVPGHFTAEMKADFAKLPPEAQTIVSKLEQAREANYTQRTQEFSEVRKKAEDYQRQAAPIFDALRPYEAYLTEVAPQIGQTIPAMLNGLLRVEYTLRKGSPEQKQAAVYDILTQYGVSLDPNSVNDAQIQTISGLRNELGQLRGYLTQQQQSQVQHVERQQAQQLEQLEGQIVAFAKDKPHFDNVSQLIFSFLKGGAIPPGPPSERLQKAYDMAVYADPTTRASLELEARKVADAKRAAEVAQRTAAAKKAAAPNVRAAPPTPSSKPKGMFDTLSEAYDNAQQI